MTLKEFCDINCASLHALLVSGQASPPMPSDKSTGPFQKMLPRICPESSQVEAGKSVGRKEMGRNVVDTYTMWILMRTLSNNTDYHQYLHIVSQNSSTPADYHRRARGSAHGRRRGLFWTFAARNATMHSACRCCIRCCCRSICSCWVCRKRHRRLQ